ncbi:MAG: nucleotide sugar dehydrogenase [Phycisphaera sp.]|nr:nucleotide sugar dehydrogenase [Phycisphaera sp.]
MTDACVIGLGYVGLPTASLMATAGLHVVGVDVNAERVDAIERDEVVMDEAGLGTLVSAARKSGNLRASIEPVEAEVFVICVPTPVTGDQHADLSMVEAAARAIAPLVRPGNLVILESTSPIGTTRNVVGGALRDAGLAPGVDVHLCYCPERVLPGNTVAELINNHRVIGGVTERCARRARDMYARFCQGEITTTDDLTAEMVKLTENTFRDVNIALANTLARIAEDAGVDVWRVIELANRHPRVNVHQPGPGVGGHCIPVDPWFLVDGFPRHAQLITEARTINDTQPRRVLDRLVAIGAVRPGDTIAILGAAYKADIDDSRSSPGAALAAVAREAGFDTRLHDPRARRQHPGDEPITRDLTAALQGAAAAVVCTDHAEYRRLTPAVFTEHMAGRVLFDARRCLDPGAFIAAGFTLLAIGVGDAAPVSPPLAAADATRADVAASNDPKSC